MRCRSESAASSAVLSWTTSSRWVLVVAAWYAARSAALTPCGVSSQVISGEVSEHDGDEEEERHSKIQRRRRSGAGSGAQRPPPQAEMSPSDIAFMNKMEDVSKSNQQSLLEGMKSVLAPLVAPPPPPPPPPAAPAAPAVQGLGQRIALLRSALADLDALKDSGVFSTEEVDEARAGLKAEFGFGS